MSKDRILLSICIPTFNRADQLKDALFAASRELASVDGEVEVIVSDNCSNDQTAEYVREFGELKYFRNDSNVGAARNFHRCVERAQGEFVWIIGDDDVLLPGSVSRVLAIVRQNHADYIFAAVTCLPATQRDRLADLAFLRGLAAKQPHGYEARPTGIVNDWSELVDPAIGWFLGSIMTSIFRRGLWLSAISEIELEGEFGTSLSSVFPHCVAFARSLPGHPAYYIGEPCVLSFQGRQEWLGFFPAIFAVWDHRVLDTYAANGVPASQIRKCRKPLLRISGIAAWRLFLNPRCPGRQEFSFARYIRSYWRFWEMWAGLAPVIRVGRAIGRRLGRAN
jgi:glycosyltransferase involved in cell wall biosynthesis